MEGEETNQSPTMPRSETDRDCGGADSGKNPKKVAIFCNQTAV
jgi:hypothetical protein